MYYNSWGQLCFSEMCCNSGGQFWFSEVCHNSEDSWDNSAFLKCVIMYLNRMDNLGLLKCVIRVSTVLAGSLKGAVIMWTSLASFLSSLIVARRHFWPVLRTVS